MTPRHIYKHNLAKTLYLPTQKPKSHHIARSVGTNQALGTWPHTIDAHTHARRIAQHGYAVAVIIQHQVADHCGPPPDTLYIIIRARKHIAHGYTHNITTCLSPPCQEESSSSARQNMPREYRGRRWLQRRPDTGSRSPVQG